MITLFNAPLFEVLCHSYLTLSRRRSVRRFISMHDVMSNKRKTIFKRHSATEFGNFEVGRHKKVFFQIFFLIFCKSRLRRPLWCRNFRGESHISGFLGFQSAVHGASEKIHNFFWLIEFFFGKEWTLLHCLPKPIAAGAAIFIDKPANIAQLLGRDGIL